MKTPIHRLKKDEIVKLAKFRCEHGHSGLEHYGCYVGGNEKIGFLDIETTNLDANFGIMLSYCIKDGDSDKIYEGCITAQDIKKGTAGDEDFRIVQKCVEDIKQFTKLVTFYGVRFDMPFVRTRAVSLGVEFPSYGTIKHQDLYFLIRNKFKLNSNRLENACRVLLGSSDKTKIDYKHWRAAARGDKKALEYVLKHNRYDVLDLEKLYHKVMEYQKEGTNSL
jgi:uncharacterized protein YprB with RNaseH-like and TPR domain